MVKMNSKREMTQKNKPSSSSSTARAATATASSHSLMKSKKNKNRTLSKALSWVLRHSAPQLKLNLSSDGYVPLAALLSCPARKLNTYTIEDVREVVETNDKQRFKLDNKIVIWHGKDGGKLKYSFADDSDENVVRDGDGQQAKEELCIRANQGHSIKGISCEDLLTPISSEELKELTIIHGTNRDAWDEHIQFKGLNKMKRNHIHFAPGLPNKDGVISGMRKTCQVYIYIDGSLCAEDNIKFYKSDNGVILTAGDEHGTLPCQYFSSVVDAKTNKDLLIPIHKDKDKDKEEE